MPYPWDPGCPIGLQFTQRFTILYLRERESTTSILFVQLQVYFMDYIEMQLGAAISQRFFWSGVSFPRLQELAQLNCSSSWYYNVARSGVSIRVAIYPEIVQSGVSCPRLEEFAQLYCSSSWYYNDARSGVSIRVAIYPEILLSGVSFPRLQECAQLDCSSTVTHIFMLPDPGCPFGLQITLDFTQSGVFSPR